MHAIMDTKEDYKRGSGRGNGGQGGGFIDDEFTSDSSGIIIH